MRVAVSSLALVLAAAACAEHEPAPKEPARVAVVIPTPSPLPTIEGRAAVRIDDTDAGEAEVARAPEFQERDATMVERPPFAEEIRTLPPALGVVVPAPRLVKAQESRNGITDHEAWFKRVGKELPMLEVPNPFMGKVGKLPADLPAKYRNAIAILALDHGDHVIIVYGANFSAGRFLAVFDAQHRLTSLLDFGTFMTPPTFVPADAQFVQGGILWAEQRDGVLYVATGHHTYAKSSHGKNAFLTAVDPATGRIFWQSAPLVSNARDFIVRRGFIVSGYGFTAEPDFLFVIDRANGHTVSKIPVKSGPEVLLEKDNRLFVRTYDTDVVFDIR